MRACLAATIELSTKWNYYKYCLFSVKRGILFSVISNAYVGRKCRLMEILLATKAGKLLTFYDISVTKSYFDGYFSHSPLMGHALMFSAG